MNHYFTFLFRNKFKQVRLKFISYNFNQFLLRAISQVILTFCLLGFSETIQFHKWQMLLRQTLVILSSIVSPTYCISFELTQLQSIYWFLFRIAITIKKQLHQVTEHQVFIILVLSGEFVSSNKESQEPWLIIDILTICLHWLQNILAHYRIYFSIYILTN